MIFRDISVLSVTITVITKDHCIQKKDYPLPMHSKKRKSHDSSLDQNLEYTGSESEYCYSRQIFCNGAEKWRSNTNTILIKILIDVSQCTSLITRLQSVFLYAQYTGYMYTYSPNEYSRDISEVKYRCLDLRRAFLSH